MEAKQKIDWLAVLQGFSMLLVVIGHVDLTNKGNDCNFPIASAIHSIIYSFHMPLFVFISGWLFYYTCIRKDKNNKDVMVAKLRRLGVPFLAFTLIATALKMAFPSLMHRQVTLQELVNTFVLFRSNPLGEMWFIVVLLVLMSFYPAYRWAFREKWALCLLLLLSMIVYIYPLHITIFYVKKVCHMAPFFVGGMLCGKYEGQKYLDGRLALCVTSVMFVAWNVIGGMPDPKKLLSICVGIAFSFSFCLNLAKRWPKLFSSFRDYTFQIFLMGIFFQMVIRWGYIRIGYEWIFVPLWLISVGVGVFIPTLIAKTIDKKASRFVKMCIGL